jgi:hypothetical protein
MSKLRRTLFADFDLHTEGDSAFKNELIILMIANVLELQRAVDFSLGAFDELRFASVCHKVLTTMRILNDRDFTGMVDEIRRDGKNTHNLLRFDSLCAQVISSLQAEMSIPDAAVVYP